LVGPQSNFRIDGRFERGGDAGEFFDLFGASLGVEAWSDVLAFPAPDHPCYLFSVGVVVSLRKMRAFGDCEST
jgi:hypothetical protein